MTEGQSSMDYDAVRSQTDKGLVDMKSIIDVLKSLSDQPAFSVTPPSGLSSMGTVGEGEAIECVINYMSSTSKLLLSLRENVRSPLKSCYKKMSREKSSCDLEANKLKKVLEDAASKKTMMEVKCGKLLDELNAKQSSGESTAQARSECEIGLSKYEATVNAYNAVVVDVNKAHEKHLLSFNALEKERIQVTQRSLTSLRKLLATQCAATQSVVKSVTACTDQRDADDVFEETIDRRDASMGVYTPLPEAQVELSLPPPHPESDSEEDEDEESESERRQSVRPLPDAELSDTDSDSDSDSEKKQPSEEERHSQFTLTQEARLKKPLPDLPTPKPTKSPPPPVVDDDDDHDRPLPTPVEVERKVMKTKKNAKEVRTPPEPKTKRDRIAAEIISTEVSYVKQLNSIVTNYVIPLRAVAGGEEEVLTKVEIDTLFSNAMTLAQLNETFLTQLQERHLDWAENDCVGDLFMSFAPFFKMYTVYIENHASASRVLEKLEKNVRWGEFKTKVTANCPTALPLFSLLITPIQRVPRYKLLLAELLSKTEKGHKDEVKLKEALEMISVSAKHINEAVRQRENRDAIRAIEEKFIGDVSFTAPSRVFLKQGPLTKKCRSKDQTYEFFLFNDMICYARSIPGAGYKLHKKLPMSGGFQAQPVPAEMSGTQFPSMMFASAKKSFVVYTKTEAEKVQWLTEINTAIQSHRTHIGAEGDAQASIRPVWKQDHTTSECPTCHNKFTMLYRKHHCRKCGNLVCGDCSKGRVVLRKGKKAERVCDTCVKLSKNQTSRSSPTPPKSPPPGAAPGGAKPPAGPPPALQEAQVRDAREASVESVVTEDDASGSESESEDEGVTEDQYGPLLPDWVMYYTDEEVAYYYNTETKETVWVRPGGIPK